jgi:hypothetical protein
MKVLGDTDLPHSDISFSHIAIDDKAYPATGKQQTQAWSLLRT